MGNTQSRIVEKVLVRHASQAKNDQVEALSHLENQRWWVIASSDFHQRPRRQLHVGKLADVFEGLLNLTLTRILGNNGEKGDLPICSPTQASEKTRTKGVLPAPPRHRNENPRHF